MSGIPRPVTDLPNSSISVRLIRGDLSNNITNFPSNSTPARQVKTVKTDDSGRAQFSTASTARQSTVKAIAVVDGERLESQEFPVPAAGRRASDARRHRQDESAWRRHRRRRRSPVRSSSARSRASSSSRATRRSTSSYLLDVREHRPGAGEPAGAVRHGTADRRRQRPDHGVVRRRWRRRRATARHRQRTVSAPVRRSCRSRCGMPSGSGSIDVTQAFPTTSSSWR